MITVPATGPTTKVIREYACGRHLAQAVTSLLGRFQPGTVALVGLLGAGLGAEGYPPYQATLQPAESHAEPRSQEREGAGTPQGPTGLTGDSAA